MPFVRIETNLPDQPVRSAAIILAVTDLVAKVKPEVQRRGIAVSLVHDCSLAFDANPNPPAVVVNVVNAKMPHEVTLPLTQGLTQILGESYGVSPARTYCFFHELTSTHLVGLMGVTFVELAASVPAAASGAGVG